MADDINVLDGKRALPNKLLNEDGTITDLMGNAVLTAVSVWQSKKSLPNKFLNPDGTYSTLQEIISGSVDTELFVIVQELPSIGLPNKIYLLPKASPQTGFYEYSYTDNSWNIIGDVDIDLSNYSTTQEVQAAIAIALQNAKDYTDEQLKNFVPLQSFPVSFDTTHDTETFFNSIKNSNPTVGSYYLGLVRLTDMPTGLIQAEVQVAVYPNKVLYATMRSADTEPYVWECNSYDYQGWVNQSAGTLQDAKAYTDQQIGQALGGEY